MKSFVVIRQKSLELFRDILSLVDDAVLKDSALDYPFDDLISRLVLEVCVVPVL